MRKRGRYALGVVFAVAAVFSLTGCTGGDEGPFVSAGPHTTCGVKSNGRLSCFGADGSGQVSGPNADTSTFTQVGAGDGFTCAVRLDSRVVCWGSNLDGQVSGPNADTSTFSQISAAEEHVCALKTSGRLACWGDDSGGRVSGPNASTQLFKSVSVGESHTCGLKTDGRILCWGGSSSQVTGPNASRDKFIQITADTGVTCAVKTTGRLACWGSDTSGSVSGPNASADTFAQLSAGGTHTCGVKSNGRLACWGSDSFGEVSEPNASTDTFTQVSSGDFPIVDCCPPEIIGVVGHTCALKTSGDVQCWGFNGDFEVSGPNASPDVFGYPPAELVLLEQRFQDFAPGSSTQRTLLRLTEQARAAFAGGDTAGTCNALGSLASKIVSYRREIKPYQAAVLNLMIQGIMGSVGCP